MRKDNATLWFFTACFFLTAELKGSTVPQVSRVGELEDQIIVIQAEESDSGLGRYITWLGDVNGDGLGDFAFSGYTPTFGTGADNVGFIFFGAKPLPRRIDLSRWQAWGIRIVSPRGKGIPVPSAGLGDIDGDGYDDFLFDLFDPPGLKIITFGGPDLPLQISLHGFSGCRISKITADSSLEGNLNTSKCATGDVNGDGLPDLCFAFAGANRRAEMPGEGVVYVLFGRRPFPEKVDLGEALSSGRATRIVAPQGFLAPDQTRGPSFGWRITSGHDFDSDGCDEIVISAPGWTYSRDSGLAGGAAFVVFGREHWPQTMDLTDRAAEEQRVCRIFSKVEMGGIGFNTCLAAPDLTGDSKPDLLLSTSGLGSSKVSVVSGADLRPGDYFLEAMETIDFVGQAVRLGPSVATVLERNGDGMYDIALGGPAGFHSAIEYGTYGVVWLVAGRAAFPRLFQVFARQDDLSAIYGPSQGSAFGAAIVGGDMDGDGLSEVIVSAPGRSMPGLPGESIGRVYVIPGTVDLLGELVGESFAPKTSSTSGGNRLIIRGRGFDETTEVFLGSRRLEILERPDSRRIVARIPEMPGPTTVPVTLKSSRGTFVFEDRFTFFESVLPYEVDVENMGPNGFVVVETGRLGFVNHPFSCKGGYDFTGDGKAEILVAYYPSRGINIPPRPGRVFLIHGSDSLPQSVTTQELSDLSTIFVSEEQEDLLGKEAFLVGDMNGDGRSELVISAPFAGAVYVIYGGEVPKGEVTVQDLAWRRGFTIFDCPIEIEGKIRRPGIQVALTGDVNGDGFKDFGLLAMPQEYTEDGRTWFLGSIAFVLGKPRRARQISYNSLPKVYAKLPPAGGLTADMLACKELGDVDGDGYDDIALLCYSTDNPELDGDQFMSGVFVFFGRSWLQPYTTMDREIQTGGAVQLLANTRAWAGSVWGIGDQNGDGRDDMAIKCEPNAETAKDKQRIYVLYGRRREELAAARDLRKPADFDVYFPKSPDFNGSLTFVQGGRDFNGDGFPDILVSDFHVLEAPPPARGICVFGGNLEEKEAPLGEIRDVFQLVSYKRNTDPDWFGAFPGNFYFAGDVNGDGFEDVIANCYRRVFVYFNPLGQLDPHYPFVRGDANQDTKVDIADAIAVLSYLFGPSGMLPCLDAADVNDDERINVADPIRLLMYLFGGGVPLPPPLQCGPDPQGSALGCKESVCW